MPRSGSIDGFEVRRVARLIGPAPAAKQFGIARSSVYRILAENDGVAA